MSETANWNAQLDPAFVEQRGSRFGDAWNDHDPEAIVARFSVAGIDRWTLRGERLCLYSTHNDKGELARQLELTAAGKGVA